MKTLVPLITIDIMTIKKIARNESACMYAVTANYCENHYSNTSYFFPHMQLTVRGE